MRVIGKLNNEASAKRFGDFLYVTRIPNTVEEDHGEWIIWVHDDDQLKEAADWLVKFQADPNSEEFSRATQAESLRNEEQRDLKAFQNRTRSRAEMRKRFLPGGLGKLTGALMAISIAVSLYSSLGNNSAKIMFLFITEWTYGVNDLIVDHSLPEIRSGQIWRLFTPMFIHFGVLHILFNMMWLRDLGSMIESREGAWRLLILVLITSAGSNLAQFFIRVPVFPPLDGGHPVFGGMSGVVYGLFGYIWMRGKFARRATLILHKTTVNMMLIWLVVCMTGLLGHIANLAHLSGLLIGMVAGIIFSKLETQRENRSPF